MDLTLKRNSRKDLSVIVSGDYSEKQLTFAVKETQSSSVRKITKRNTLAGGSDNELTAVFNSSTNQTTITIKINPSDTLNLNPVKHFGDITAQTDSTDKIYIYHSGFVVEQVVQRDNDTLDVPQPNTYSPVYYQKYFRFTKVSNSASTEKAKLGYGDLTITESNNVISVNSSEDFSDETCIYCNNSEVNYSYINSSLIEFYMPESYGKAVIEIWEK